MGTVANNESPDEMLQHARRKTTDVIVILDIDVIIICHIAAYL